MNREGEMPATLPQWFLSQVKKYGDTKVSVRQKELGIWQEFHWQEAYEQVKLFSLGLLELGARRGDKIATIGDNDRYYLWGYLALQAIGCAQVGLFVDSTAKEISYVINHSNSTFVLAKDQEQIDKLLDVQSELSNIRKVIYWDDQGLWNYNNPWLISFSEVQALGEMLAQKERNRFKEEVTQGKGQDLGILCYTSGTTGLPKGAMLSHSNLINVVNAFHQVDPRYDSDNHVSILQMGWIGEHTLGVAPHVRFGLIMNFPEAPETITHDLREIAPDSLLYGPRQWDGLIGMVQLRINDSTWFNRKLYHYFLPIGYRVADKTLVNEPIGLGLKIAYALGELLLFAPLRDQLGLSQVRYAYTAGATLSPDAVRFYHAVGVNLKQIYGSTEVAGGATTHYTNDIKFASVGKPVPDVLIKISEEGEILIGGDTVFIGYHNNPEATQEAISVDDAGIRWFHTGDAGYLDEDGHVIYLDRLKDMLTLANGEKFSPQFIEGRLKFSPYIRDAMVIGGETREFVTALIIIDFENSSRWAEKKQLSFTTFTDLSQKSTMYDLVQTTVQEVNTSLPIAACVKRFILMHKAFDADEAEMTRSRKLRRGVLQERYKDMITAMYAGKSSIKAQAPIRYQDGSEGFVEVEVAIQTAT